MTYSIWKVRQQKLLKELNRHSRSSGSSTCLCRFVGTLDGLLGTSPSSSNLACFLVVSPPLKAKGLLQAKGVIAKELLGSGVGMLANRQQGALLVLGVAGAMGIMGFLSVPRVLGVNRAVGVDEIAATVSRLARLAPAAAAAGRAPWAA